MGRMDLVAYKIRSAGAEVTGALLKSEAANALRVPPSLAGVAV